MDECNCYYPRLARCRCSARFYERCDYCDWQWGHDCPGIEGEDEDGEDGQPARD
jgi:hypothetical protein